MRLQYWGHPGPSPESSSRPNKLVIGFEVCRSLAPALSTAQAHAVCTLLEGCGRFLHRHRETHDRCAAPPLRRGVGRPPAVRSLRAASCNALAFGALISSCHLVYALLAYTRAGFLQVSGGMKLCVLHFAHSDLTMRVYVTFR
eukprot:2927742-Pleurochrysis_carterae.AAC.2